MLRAERPGYGLAMQDALAKSIREICGPHVLRLDVQFLNVGRIVLPSRQGGVWAR